MDPVLLASVLDARLWYAVPLIVAISLVYGATRHEYVPEILKQSLKAGVWVAGFMAIIFGLILVGDFFV